MKFAAACLAGLVYVSLPAACQLAAPPAARVMDYAGTWNVEIDTPDPATGKVDKDVSRVRNDCWSSGEFAACHQIVNGKTGALLVFTYDAAKKVFASYIVPPDGSEAHKGTLVMDGDVWIFPWQGTDEHGGTMYFRVVNVWHGPAAIAYRREKSSDNVHWVAMATGHEEKQP